MKLLAALLVGAGAHIALSAPVMAEPCTGVYNQGSCRPAPWNGQLMDTWNIPGSYGGWTNTPIACNPMTTKFYIETHCVAWRVTAEKLDGKWNILNVASEDC